MRVECFWWNSARSHNNQRVQSQYRRCNDIDIDAHARTHAHTQTHTNTQCHRYRKPHTHIHESPYRSFLRERDSVAVWVLDQRTQWVHRWASHVWMGQWRRLGCRHSTGDPTRRVRRYLSESLSSLDSTSSRAACRSTMRRMDVSRSACNVCRTAVSSVTCISCTDKKQQQGCRVFYEAKVIVGSKRSMENRLNLLQGACVQGV